MLTSSSIKPAYQVLQSSQMLSLWKLVNHVFPFATFSCPNPVRVLALRFGARRRRNLKAYGASLRFLPSASSARGRTATAPTTTAFDGSRAHRPWCVPRQVSYPLRLDTEGQSSHVPGAPDQRGACAESGRQSRSAILVVAEIALPARRYRAVNRMGDPMNFNLTASGIWLSPASFWCAPSTCMMCLRRSQKIGRSQHGCN